MPALRERSDFKFLVDALLGRICDISGASPRKLTDLQMGRLKSHQWPGNVRELESVLARYLVMGEIEISVIPRAGPIGEDVPTGNLKAFTDRQRAQAAEEALGMSGGDVEEASRQLGISRSQFYRIRSKGRNTDLG